METCVLDINFGEEYIVIVKDDENPYLAFFNYLEQRHYYICGFSMKNYYIFIKDGVFEREFNEIKKDNNYFYTHSYKNIELDDIKTVYAEREIDYNEMVMRIFELKMIRPCSVDLLPIRKFDGWEKDVHNKFLYVKVKSIA